MLFLESFSLADRCFPSDCTERSDAALWHGAADWQPPGGEVGPACEGHGRGAPGREPALRSPAPPQGDPHSGLPRPPQGNNGSTPFKQAVLTVRPREHFCCQLQFKNDSYLFFKLFIFNRDKIIFSQFKMSSTAQKYSSFLRSRLCCTQIRLYLIYSTRPDRRQETEVNNSFSFL